MNKNKTQWRKVSGYPEYGISDSGQIRMASDHAGRTIGETLPPYMGSNGYLLVNLMRNGIWRTYAIHKLVARAFIGPAPVGVATVEHLDGYKLNNHFSNLRWEAL